MKRKKLDMRGFSHDMVIVAFVVIFAITGTAYLVASHADSNCPPVSGATSGPASSANSGAVSNSNCQPVSGVNSGPVTGPAIVRVVTGSCIINGVPSNPAYSQVLVPSVTLSNTGNQAFAPSGNVNIETFADSGDLGGKGGPISVGSLAPGRSTTIGTGLRYTVSYSSTGARRVVFSVNNNSPKFSCSATATLPAAPTPPAPHVAAACSITGVPQNPRYGQVLRPTLAITNTGNVPLSTRVQSSLTLYNSKGQKKSFQSQQFAIQLVPRHTYYAGMAQYRVPRSSNNIAKGSYGASSRTPAFGCSANFKLPSFQGVR